MLERIRHALLKKRREQIAYWDLVERAEDHLRALDEDNERDWRLSETRATVDLAEGRIRFIRPNGSVASAEIQCAGIFGNAGSWSWTWEHPQIDKTLQEQARRVREYGERHAMNRLTTKAFVSTEVEAWGLTAVACLLNRAEGAWRIRVPVGYLYVLFSNLSGARPQELLDYERPPLPVDAD